MLSGSSKKHTLPWIFPALIGSQIFTVFLTETKFVPFIRTNVGAFELNGAFLIAATLLYFWKHARPVKLHPLIVLLWFWFSIALVSIVQLIGIRLLHGFIYVIVLLFQVFFTAAFYNLLLLRKDYLLYLFRCLAVSVAIVGAWVLLAQIGSPGDENAVGPFDGRSQMGIYMFACFWMLLMYRFWPGVSRWERLGLYPVMVLVLYTIAVSGRQSVFVGALVGAAGLLLSFVALRGWRRFELTGHVIVAGLFVAFVLLNGGKYLGQLDYFRGELLTLGDRVRLATASESDAEVLDNDDEFDLMQRRGAIQAFKENPILGIGWTGFWRSKYSHTGNELHSSAWRFVAELGLIGIVIYVGFLGIVFSRAVRLFLLARGTPYRSSALVLLIGFGSEFVSHYYNRMFTDRPYWLMLVIFIAFEALILSETKALSVAPVASKNKTTPELKPLPAAHG